MSKVLRTEPGTYQVRDISSVMMLLLDCFRWKERMVVSAARTTEAPGTRAGCGLEPRVGLSEKWLLA